MAKTSSIEKNNKRRRMALAQAPKRKRLKAACQGSHEDAGRAFRGAAEARRNAP